MKTAEIQQIGHNSVQIPHDGVLSGASFGGKKGKFSHPKVGHFFRPTSMSLALAAVDVIPDVHLVRELSCTARLRHKHDSDNCRVSAFVAF